MALQLSGSVGRGGKNGGVDVATVQLVLSLAPTRSGPEIAVDGKIGEATYAAIDDFQKKAGTSALTGRVEPNGSTWLLMQSASAAVMEGRTWIPFSCAPRLTEFDYKAAAAQLRCELAAIQAVAEVESKGDGFFASGRPKILFEAHVFSSFTKHKYDAVFSDISSRKWDQTLYAYGEKEYDRLEKAMLLDREAALKSASWGRFQIMGFNHKLAGHSTVQEMVAAMCGSERAQLDGFVSFVNKQGLDVVIKSKAWAKFAEKYNGAEYAKNKYDEKMKAAYDRFSKLVAKK